MSRCRCRIAEDGREVSMRPNESGFLSYKSPGAYGVRYHFVIYGFSLAATGNVGRTFLLGRALEAEGSEPF